MTEHTIERPFFASTPTVAVAATRTANDVGRELGRSGNSIKRMLLELGLPIKRTSSGIWLLDAADVAKLRAEIQRREMERLR